MCWGSLRPGQFREVTLPRGWAPAPASIVSRPLASGADAADGDSRKRDYSAPAARTLAAPSAQPSSGAQLIPPAAGGSRAWGGNCEGGTTLPHPPTRLHLRPAGPATRCLAGHEACLGASVASQALGWDRVGPGPTAFKLRVGPRVDVYPLIPHSHWEICRQKEMATHSSILAWKIPWVEERG